MKIGKYSFDTKEDFINWFNQKNFKENPEVVWENFKLYQKSKQEDLGNNIKKDDSGRLVLPQGTLIHGVRGDIDEKTLEAISNEGLLPAAFFKDNINTAAPFDVCCFEVAQKCTMQEYYDNYNLQVDRTYPGKRNVFNKENDEFEYFKKETAYLPSEPRCGGRSKFAFIITPPSNRETILSERKELSVPSFENATTVPIGIPTNLILGILVSKDLLQDKNTLSKFMSYFPDKYIISPDGELVYEPQKEKKEIDSVKDLLTDEKYSYFAHGIGRSGDKEEIVDSIFEQGLRTNNNLLYWTSIQLDSTNWDELKEKLDNWPHENSKKIIIVRLPNEFINDKYGRGAGAPEEHYPFYIQRDKGNGEMHNYVDKRFVMGCYYADTKDVRINPDFELDLSEKTIEELTAKFEKSMKMSEDRINDWDFFSGATDSIREEEYNTAMEEGEGVTWLDDFFDEEEVNMIEQRHIIDVAGKYGEYLSRVAPQIEYDNNVNYYIAGSLAQMLYANAKSIEYCKVEDGKIIQTENQIDISEETREKLSLTGRKIGDLDIIRLNGYDFEHRNWKVINQSFVEQQIPNINIIHNKKQLASIYGDDLRGDLDNSVTSDRVCRLTTVNGENIYVASPETIIAQKLHKVIKDYGTQDEEKKDIKDLVTFVNGIYDCYSEDELAERVAEAWSEKKDALLVNQRTKPVFKKRFRTIYDNEIQPMANMGESENNINVNDVAVLLLKSLKRYMQIRETQATNTISPEALMKQISLDQKDVEQGKIIQANMKKQINQINEKKEKTVL